MMTLKRKKKHRATPNQTSIAATYGIPLWQAHTINGDKVHRYFKYLASPLARLEHWFNAESLKRGDNCNG